MIEDAAPEAGPLSDDDDQAPAPRRIQRLADLAGRSFSKFAVSVQHQSEAVQLAVIAQLPEFRKLASKALESLEADFQKFADLEHENEAQLHQSFRRQQKLLSGMVHDAVSVEDKLLLLREISDLQTRWASFIRENKRHKLKVVSQRTLQVVGVVAVVAIAVVGGKVLVDQGGLDES